MKNNNTAPEGAQDNCGAIAQLNASAHPIEPPQQVSETPAGKQVADDSDSPERHDLGAATCSPALENHGSALKPPIEGTLSLCRSGQILVSYTRFGEWVNHNVRFTKFGEWLLKKCLLKDQGAGKY